jgi:flagellar M-ring protein FliF
MPPALAGPLNKVRSTLATISLGQKVVIGLLLAGLVLGGVFFTKWVTAPTMAPLFSNLAASDASAIVGQLNTDGVSYTLADGGATIMVPQAKVAGERLAVSAKGLPASDATGYSLLDQQGITTSEFQQQVNYQRAIEGELDNTLKALDGVQTAVVHVAMPKDDVFATDAGKATASVLLDLKPGTKLSGEQIQAVTHLVASSIQGMSPDDVTVADQSGAVLSAPGSGVASGASDQQTAEENAYEAQLAANAQKILDRVVGDGKSVVSVKADLDFDQKSTTSEAYNYTPNTPPVSSSTSSEKYTGTNNAVGGVLGNESTTGSTTGGNGNYDKETTTSDNAVGKTTQTTESAPGTVNRLTVSVALDSTKAGALDQNAIQSLIGNAVGLNTTRGDAITVASMPFDTSAAKQAAADLAAANAAAKQAATWKTIKTGAIAAGIGLLVLLVWLRSRRRRGEDYEELEPVDEPLEPMHIESVRDPALDDRATQLAAAQREKVRGEISEMVSERPDEVATMLRGWFADAP